MNLVPRFNDPRPKTLKVTGRTSKVYRQTDVREFKSLLSTIVYYWLVDFD